MRPGLETREVAVASRLVVGGSKRGATGNTIKIEFA
jgi:hypothetical protein